MNKYLVTLYTNWCGEDNEYLAYAESESELESNADLGTAAYENFSDFGGFEKILEELFPDVEEYTDEMEAEAAEVEREYYGYSIEEFPEDHEESWYDIIYDARKES